MRLRIINEENRSNEELERIYAPLFKNLFYNNIPKEYSVVTNILNNVSFNNIKIDADLHFTDYMVYDDVDNHNISLIRRHNESINDNNVYINLGDLGRKFIDKEYYLFNYICKLNKCKYGILVRGNNDIYDDQFYLNAGFNFVCNGFIWNGFVFTHFPLFDKNNTYNLINIHGHNHDRPINYDDPNNKFPFKMFGKSVGYLVYSRDNNFHTISLQEIVNRLKQKNLY